MRWFTITALLGWIILSFSAAALGGLFSPGDWYRSLNKPTWNPPGWIFGPVWTALYTAMGVAAWRVWRHGGWRVQRTPLIWFLIQLALNAAWTPLFFGLQQPGLAFAEIVLLCVAIAVTLGLFWRTDPIAGWLFVPYLAWVSFASLLNFVLWRMNP
jgi:translocator protein